MIAGLAAGSGTGLVGLALAMTGCLAGSGFFAAGALAGASAFFGGGAFFTGAIFLVAAILLAADFAVDANLPEPFVALGRLALLAALSRDAMVSSGRASRPRYKCNHPRF